MATAEELYPPAEEFYPLIKVMWPGPGRFAVVVNPRRRIAGFWTQILSGKLARDSLC